MSTLRVSLVLLTLLLSLLFPLVSQAQYIVADSQGLAITDDAMTSNTTTTFVPSINQIAINVNGATMGTVLVDPSDRFVASTILTDLVTGSSGPLVLAGATSSPTVTVDPSSVLEVTAQRGATAEGYVSGLFVQCASSNSVTVSAVAIVMKDENDCARTFRGISNELASMSVIGAQGRDSTDSPSTWYSIWLIGKNDGTVDAMLSKSLTSPSMPSGYRFRRRVGMVRNDGNGAGDFRRFTQSNNIVRVPQSFVSGGTTTQSPAFDIKSFAEFYPPVARMGTVTGWIIATASTQFLQGFVIDPATAMQTGAIYYQGHTASDQWQFYSEMTVSLSETQTVGFCVQNGSKMQLFLYATAYIDPL